ncbi:glycoside hydrolase family 130 protein [Bosea sp. RCC_152_1]|uniref:glycoside hydrolase family 130 protein n=1 Tax=unclassified Bosea (in: a-proteobacteria) TaxID=2653178 RepID=UPI001151A290
MSQPSFLNRQTLHLRPDPSRVVVRRFGPAGEPQDFNPAEKAKANHIVNRVLSLDPDEAANLLAEVLENFNGRHRNLLERFEARADEMEDAFAAHGAFTKVQRQLVGAYFLHEYSFEAAALFNPSIIAHPDQSNAPAGGLRFILSVRAVGEGHISSLTFRSGSIAADGEVSVDPTSRLATIATLHNRMARLDGEDVEVVFAADSDISERVIFPVTAAQSNGIEDARFVAFEEDDGIVYRATYTAYDGRSIRSELIETRDFLSFRLSPLRGAAAVNKGMALFPRKLGGRYAMISRQDNENLHLIYSDDLLTWDGGVALLKPRYPWEFVQIGTCGSPIELDEGWLLLIHGVGAVRKYTIGAVLLDKADPSKVLGRLRQPFVQPEPSEREGYVPNVVYTCGAIRHRDLIVLPYAVSDTFCHFATVKVAALLEAIEAEDSWMRAGAQE